MIKFSTKFNQLFKNNTCFSKEDKFIKLINLLKFPISFIENCAIWFLNEKVLFILTQNYEFEYPANVQIN